ncbi:MAG: phosphodiester glycosidase family protein, partial [Deltaproteobacteria bacterium]|nr:phosphodiester glycosidase family protein [Deltaproteobacteria bacterium]
ALAAINGGFFLPDYRPLGLLIIDGRETNPLRQTDWGIFLIQANRPRIIHTKEFQNEGTISQALQVGPRLVVNGRELRLKKQLAKRSAVGITFKNQIILLNSEDTDVYAQDLARIFHLPESEGGLECRDALTLDGGPSAQMYAEYKSLKIDLPGGWPVPNGIGVFKPLPQFFY